MATAMHSLAAWAAAAAFALGSLVPGAPIRGAAAASEVTRAPGPGPSGPTTPKPRTVEVDGIFGHLTLSGVEIVDGRFDGQTLARALDPPSAADAPRLLEALTARAIYIDGMTITAGAGKAPDWHLDHVRIQGAERGKLAAVSIKKVTLSGATASPLVLSDVDMQAFDVALLAQSLTLTRKQADAPLSRLCDSFGFTSVSRLPGGALSAAVSGGGIRVRPLLMSRDQVVGSPAGEQGKRGWQMLGDLVDSVAVDRLEIADLVFRPANGSGVATLARMRAAGVAGGGLRDLTLERMAFNDKSVAITLERFALKDVRFREALTTLETLGPKDINPQALKPFVEEMELRKFNVASAGDTDRFGLERLLIDGSTQSDAKLLRRRVTLDRLYWNWPATTRDAFATRLSSLGFRSLGVSATLNWVLDVDKELFRADVFAEGAGIGRLALRTELDHFSGDVADAHRSVALSALLKIRLQRLVFRYDDDGLAARLLALDPILSKTTPQQRRADAQAAIVAAARRWGLADLPPALDPFIAAIQAFAADPRSLDVSLVAPQGVGMREVPLLKSPRDLLRRVELTATANR